MFGKLVLSADHDGEGACGPRKAESSIILVLNSKPNLPAISSRDREWAIDLRREFAKPTERIPERLELIV